MALAGLKYILAVFMMYAGIMTTMLPPEPSSRLGFIYESRVSLVVFGIIFFLSGLTLLVGKIKKWRRVEGWGLMANYLCFFFAFILNWVGLGWGAAWGNLIVAVVVAGLYLRWKYHIFYYEPVDKTSPVV